MADLRKLSADLTKKNPKGYEILKINGKITSIILFSLLFGLILLVLGVVL